MSPRARQRKRKVEHGPLVIGGAWATIEDGYRLDMGEAAFIRQTTVGTVTAPIGEPLTLFEIVNVPRRRRPTAKELYAESRRERDP